MEYLKSQEDLEILLGFQPQDGLVPQPKTTCIYFTAEWCGACKALDLEAIQAAGAQTNKSVQWLKCDIDKNNYSPGYCGVRSIPAFVVIHNKKLVATLKSNKTEKAVAWLQTVLEDLS
jgi:thioredoxin-like negative regulator of GroEL